MGLSLLRFTVFSAALVAIGAGLFLLTTPTLLIGPEGLQGLAAYSEYTRNGMLVIDSDIGPLYGQLNLEQQVYSRIPRPLFPDKPSDFGSFYLAEHFFPEAFLQGQGAPAFSYGIEFADFGVLALPYLTLINLLGGLLLKMFMTGLRRYNDPGSFVLVLFFAGLSVIPLSGIFLLGETIALAVAMNLLHGFRIRPASSEPVVA
jgi:hypothetical protein